MTDLPPEQMIGTVVADRFRIDRYLGGGQMAHVFIAEQLSMQRQVALKLLRPELILDTEASTRFRREVSAVNKLQSPHTIKFHDFGELPGGRLYIAMELLGGETLRDRLERGGALPPAEAAAIVRQAGHSLDEAHAAGVIHRDLKPENLHLCPDSGSGEQPFVKVLDFGLARLLDGSGRITAPNTTVGSPAYLAPEMAVVGRVQDHRGDLYALGLIAFEMLTGTRPFDESDPFRMILAHTSHPIPSARERRPELPAALDDLMQMALAKSPELRPQSGAALARALSAALELA